MNIGEAARDSGITAKMIRYYESVDLIPPVQRTGAGYRTYDERDLDTLRFIRRARDFGVPMDRVKLLVGLWQDKNRPSREVKAIALRQVAELEARISELRAMKDAMAELADSCRGDGLPDCPILRDLEGSSPAPIHASPAARPAVAGKRLAPRRTA
ncbi:Cu(I)-responsive transcriptional regulator [Rhodopila sp.]|uniref:Cu(I)-responsive transcriptional regulator n=1 Tax=Rhodopila sp. TaxID=2480087 RepID=UPI003D0E186E